MQSQSAEYNVTRTYLEWLSDVPWSKTTPDKLDIEETRRCLDEDHFGLEKIKKRIIEYVAIRKLAGPAGLVPIIALTANAEPEDAEGYLAAGMNGVVEKPMKPEHLLAALQEALGENDAAETAARAAAAAA